MVSATPEGQVRGPGVAVEAKLLGGGSHLGLGTRDTARREHPRQCVTQLVVPGRVHVEEIGRDEARVGVDERAPGGGKGLSVDRCGMDVSRSAEHPVWGHTRWLRVSRQ
jgi:hypothetical protein